MGKPTLINKYSLTLIIWLCAGLFLTAQQTASPFDLLPRLPQSNSPDSTITITTSSNPFDLIKIHAGNRPINSRKPQFSIDTERKPITAKEKTALYQQFLFFTVLTMMVILTLLITIFRIFIGKIWQAFKRENMLSQFLREQSAGVTFAYLLLYVMFFINAGIFTFLALKHFDQKIADTQHCHFIVLYRKVSLLFTRQSTCFLKLSDIFSPSRKRSTDTTLPSSFLIS